MINRRHIMTTAWRFYRSRRPVGRFMPVLFREALRNAWGQYRMDNRPAAPILIPQPILSPMLAAIDATKCLPAHMSQARAIATSRTRYAAV